MDILQFLYWCATGCTPYVLLALALAALIFGNAAESAEVGHGYSTCFFVLGPTLIPLGGVLAAICVLSLAIFPP